MYFYISSFLSFKDILHWEQTCHGYKKLFRKHEWNDRPLYKRDLPSLRLRKYHKVPLISVYDELMNLKLGKYDVLIIHTSTYRKIMHKPALNYRLHYACKFALTQGYDYCKIIYHGLPITYQYYCSCKESDSDEMGHRWWSIMYQNVDKNSKYSRCKTCNAICRGHEYLNAVMIMKKFPRELNLSPSPEDVKILNKKKNQIGKSKGKTLPQHFSRIHAGFSVKKVKSIINKFRYYKGNMY